MTVPHVTLQPVEAGPFDGRGGWFWWRGYLIVRCPLCGRDQSIGVNHEATIDGVVTPSIGCYTIGGCPWHVFATLHGFRPDPLGKAYHLGDPLRVTVREDSVAPSP